MVLFSHLIYYSPLFYAGLSPERPAGTVAESALPLLIHSIRKVLTAAIQAGGSSLRDYVQSNGALGYFQNQFAVYNRAGKSCPNCSCGQPAIQRITQNGRSTFFCPMRQPWP
jgi:formamidopyrimidine-DNA glycosylase